ncbi:MAG: terminase small subunit [Clostridia bacterium]|nr:terminase small subunit [Clostridia bacterium]
MRAKGELKPREERFCRFYLQHQDALLAAQQAGYTGKRMEEKAEQLLLEERVLARIHTLQGRACAALGLDRSWVLLQAAEIYRRCMELRPEKRWDTATKAYVESGEHTFDGQGALRALRFIAELLGEATGDMNVAVTLIDDMEEREPNG